MSESRATLDEVLTARRDATRSIINVDEPTAKLVIFEIAQEAFAFPAEAIREILSSVTIYFVPGCPASLEGVINVRGDIESVIRLGDLLGVPAGSGDQPFQILLGRAASMSSGIRVDRVLDVADVKRSVIQPPPAVMADGLRQCARGVFRHHERPVTLLDLGHLFEDYARGLG